jgi:hypothetical protein
VDADLAERRVDPEGAEVGVALQAPDGLQVHLAHAGRPAVWPVFESLHALLDPPPQGPVDGGAVHPEVARDGLRAPTLGVQRDHGPSALGGLGDLVVGREAAHEPQGCGLLREHAPYSLAGGTPSEAHVAGVGDLVGVEARVLGLQVHDEAADGGGQAAAFGGLGAEGTLHPFGPEANDPALQRALRGRAGLLRALGGQATEQHRRADELVVPLLGPGAQELDLLPVLGRLDAAPAPVAAHVRFPLATLSRVSSYDLRQIVRLGRLKTPKRAVC